VIESPDTGWLNVRENPTTAQDNIIQKVDTGEKFAYLDKNDTGWYQIELPSGEKGWISSRYAKLVSK
jgi:uncharacterized protein YgiM (DUF1202 family)